MVETLRVLRESMDLEDPWAIPPRCTPFTLRRTTDAAPPRLATTVACWYDTTFLNVLFLAEDDHITATMLEHDAPLYREDVVEVFLAPDTLTRYYELEVNPRGTLFDAILDSPDGTRETMQTDLAWTCVDAFAGVRITRERDQPTHFDTLLRIPFAALGRDTPRDGEEWRANFYRIDRHPTLGNEFTAWQPTLKVPADFHVPAAFGAIRFVA